MMTFKDLLLRLKLLFWAHPLPPPGHDWEIALEHNYSSRFILIKVVGRSITLKCKKCNTEIMCHRDLAKHNSNDWWTSNHPIGRDVPSCEKVRMMDALE